MSLSVHKGFLDGTGLAFLRAPLVDLIAVKPLPLAELLPEALIGKQDAKGRVLDGKVAGKEIDEGFISHILKDLPEISLSCGWP
jgi:hypothetical protein